MLRISPSLASSNLLDVRSEIQKAEAARAHTLHIDIEDGNYIPNITFGQRMISLAREATDLDFSYHLMVMRPLEVLADLPVREGEIIFVHLDSCRYPRELLHAILAKGAQAGLAFNPAHPFLFYSYIFDLCRAFLILTAEPDTMGQCYILAMEEKIRQAAETEVPSIWVDGGVSKAMLSHLEACGATDAVLGRAFFQA